MNPDGQKLNYHEREIARGGLIRGAAMQGSELMARAPEVPDQLARLEKAVSELEATAETLFAALGPVLQPPMPTTAAAAGQLGEQAMQTDVGRSIHTATTRVRSLVAQMQDHRARLGV